MKPWWFLPLMAVMICSGCSDRVEPAPQQRQNTVENNLSQSTNTPNLLDGSEESVRNMKPMSLADLRAKYKSTFLLDGPSTKREVALTFDDAPDDIFTPQILEVLKREGVRATFFVVGNRVEAHPEIVRRMVEDGHILGNHSYNHANLPKISDEEFRNQITRTDELIQKYTGYRPTFVRPPYGNINEPQIQWLASQHKIIVNWNVDSLDWKGLNSEQVKTNILAHTMPGSIILQHAAGGVGEDLSGTVQALPDIIRSLRNDRMQLVTIPELLDETILR
ncbi:MAG: polysaccharide deacetylase family protein [Paenibacillus lautus]|jgi:peptidoglycan/xylan/chitin deacetylase (PgdA/CDA1 family)|uniref:polysaccharide deacetylase family protein n=1 Tax=Paenibacillus lautus TaxID=1401 RepID=UPI0026EB3C84|nr:polysaccharide deacetylase family protein [Paenibacillus lautus]MCI1777001.1 polysaccharide deacetylase family protein [Paenibacillus lautus]